MMGETPQGVGGSIFPLCSCAGTLSLCEGSCGVLLLRQSTSCRVPPLCLLALPSQSLSPEREVEGAHARTEEGAPPPCLPSRSLRSLLHASPPCRCSACHSRTKPPSGRVRSYRDIRAISIIKNRKVRNYSGLMMFLSCSLCVTV